MSEKADDKLACAWVATTVRIDNSQMQHDLARSGSAADPECDDSYSWQPP